MKLKITFPGRHWFCMAFLFSERIAIKNRMKPLDQWSQRSCIKHLHFPTCSNWEWIQMMFFLPRKTKLSSLLRNLWTSWGISHQRPKSLEWKQCWGTYVSTLPAQIHVLWLIIWQVFFFFSVINWKTATHFKVMNIKHVSRHLYKFNSKSLWCVGLSWSAWTHHRCDPAHRQISLGAK